MKLISHIVIVLSFWVGLSQPSLAASLDEARTEFKAGRYDQALAQASALDNLEGLLLAAEVLNTKIMLGQSAHAKKDSKRAMQLTQQALSQNPDSPEAKMLYAFAYGFNARSASIIKAWRKKIPQKTLAAISEARTANPNDPRSDALLGGWHLSVVYKAGSSKGKKFYSADEQTGHELFRRALAANPQDVFITGNYAMMLTALGGAENEKEALDLLQNFAPTQNANTPEQYMFALMTDLKSLSSDPRAAKKKAKTFLDW